jgi:hypothetical protein
MPRQALHAATLGFEHPISGEHMFFEQPLPPDFSGVLDKWRRYWQTMEQKMDLEGTKQCRYCLFHRSLFYNIYPAGAIRFTQTLNPARMKKLIFILSASIIWFPASCNARRPAIA